MAVPFEIGVIAPTHHVTDLHQFEISVGLEFLNIVLHY